jgi:5'-nucleotidase
MIKKYTKFYSLIILIVLVLSLTFLNGLNSYACLWKNSEVEIQLLGINDFHGQINTTKTVDGVEMGRADYLATNMYERASENKNTLMVHAGDVVGASAPVSALFNDEPTIEILNEIGFDVGTVGNHEFDDGADECERLVNEVADFPYTVSNVVYEGTNKTIFPSYYVKRVSGVKIGFVGVVIKDTENIVMPEAIEDIEFLDEIDSVNKSVKKLKRKGVETIVVLAHVPGEQNSETNEISGQIADLATGIDDSVDVIFGGHDHSGINGEVDNKLIVETYSAGKAFSDVDLVINKRTGDVIEKEAEIVNNVQEGVEPDPTIKSIIEKYELEVEPVVSQVIGVAAKDITKEQNESGESALGNLIADAQKVNMDTDFSFLNPGGIRADLDAGEITWGELFTIQPFSNYLVKMTMTGSQIRELLNQQWQKSTTRMLQISGLSYTWDSTKEAGEKVINIYDESGNELGEDTEYTITTNSFLASGGDGFSIFATISEQIYGPVDIDALVEYIESFENDIDSSIEGRINKIN